MDKRQTMQEKILKHGLTLQRHYGNGSGGGPVTLCKKLRRIERKLEKLFIDLCDVGVDDDKLEKAHKNAEKRVKQLLPNLDMASLYINQDPRGYALKIKTEYTPADLHKDWGGYGILAPDYS
jgi:hypothetical protein